MSRPTYDPGQLVRVNVECSGDRGEGLGEVTIPAGAYARVLDVVHYAGPQGWAVTIGFPNGVVNVFDEADAAPLYPFDVIPPGVEQGLALKLYALESFMDDYNRALNIGEIAPNGDDFNDLCEGFDCILAGGSLSPLNITSEGR